MGDGLKTSSILLAIGVVVIVIGLAIATYGASIVTPYSERAFNRDEAEEVVPGIKNEIGHWIDVQNENDRRRSQALQSANIARPYIVAGFVIAVLGILPLILGFIQRKSEIKDHSLKASVNSYTYCQQCGNRYLESERTQFCEKCGNSLKG